MDKLIVDVVIPSKTGIFTGILLENCITSLRNSEAEISFNVIVIESWKEITNKGQDVTLFYDQENFNYNHALNQGLEICKNKWVILANNDLIFKSGFMFEILMAHHKRPDILSFSPWNDMWAWHERTYASELEKPYPELIEGYRVCRELTGWCIVAKREIFDQISLSERVNFWYSDNVYADALIEAGIKHALATRSKVDHITSQTHQVSPLEAAQSYQDYMRK